MRPARDARIGRAVARLEEVLDRLDATGRDVLFTAPEVRRRALQQYDALRLEPRGTGCGDAWGGYPRRGALRFRVSSPDVAGELALTIVHNPDPR